MAKLIDDLKNPNFSNKGLRVLFAPVACLGYKKKAALKSFAVRHLP